MAPRRPWTQEERNAYARGKGYRNYWDYRVHDYGRIGADKPAATGDLFRFLQGKGEGGQDLRDYVAANPGDLLISMDGQARGPDGRYDRIQVTAEHKDGGVEHFYLIGDEATQDYLDDLHDWFEEHDEDEGDNYGLG